MKMLNIRSITCGGAALLVAATITGATVLPTAAHAAPASVSIGYADLDLTKPAGRTMLEKRVAAAARRICAEQRTGTRLTSAKRCEREAVAQAMASIQTAVATRATPAARAGL